MFISFPLKIVRLRKSKPKCAAGNGFFRPFGKISHRAERMR
jgi:hypothetical protein